jgi:FixJ family two-component response regulator
MPKQRRTTKRISTLRTATQREQLARLMFRGWSTKRIAHALHCSPDTVRDIKGTVEFQTLYAHYEREQLDRWDRRLLTMYTAGIDALRRQLRDRDWRARDAGA